MNDTIDKNEYDEIFPPEIEFINWVNSLEDTLVEKTETYDPFITVNS